MFAAVVAALAVLSLAAFAAPAQSAVTITSNLACCSFLGSPFSQDLGENPLYENPAGSDAPHNVTALGKGPDGGPLFASETIPQGTSSVVDGTQYLAAGSYPFYCTLHGNSMSGDLIVDGGKGTIVPRPKIGVAIPAQKLRAVRRTGKLKVRVTSLVAGGAVSLRVNLGTKLVGFTTSPPIAAGSGRTVTVSLSKSGRKAIRTGRTVKLSVKATVRFGQRVSAARNLR